VDEASRTAVLVCQGRAVAQGRLAVGRFDDPTALPLLRGAEAEAVEAVRSGRPPRGGSARMEFELLRATAEVMAVRTVVIDEAIRGRETPQLVILGAGLDGRAWRMTDLAEVKVFEVDHPSSQRDKRQRVSALESPAGKVSYVPVDFAADRLDEALEEAGHRGDEPTTWVWEGVVPYLTRVEVSTTLRALNGRCAPGSRLVVNYQSPMLAVTAGQILSRTFAFLTRRPGTLTREPWRSTWTPDAMRKLLTGHGFGQITDTDLLSRARALDVPVRGPWSLRSGHVMIADR
jgi:methyltransferase (TIGR00027 family)